MGNNNPIKIDLDKFDEHVKAIRGVGERVVDDNLTCPEPSEFMAGNPIMQEYYEMQKAIIEIRKMKKAATLLLADRLQEISDNHRAINESATQRISADKVEHNAIPVSSKTPVASPLNMPMLTTPKTGREYRASYMTGDNAIDAEINALFDEYGDNLSGLKDEDYLQLWEKLNSNRKKALARIYYVDMNSFILDYSNTGERLGNILTLLQNDTALGDGTVFDGQRLNELETLIIPNTGSVAKDVIEKMKTMSYNTEISGLNGLITLKQEDVGVSFYVKDYSGNEYETGYFTNQYRSFNYLTNLEKKEPEKFKVFKEITGLSLGDIAGYLNICNNTSDVEAMTGLITTDGTYKEVTCIDPYSLSVDCLAKLTNYSTMLLKMNKQQEYLDYINAFLDPNVNPEIKYTYTSDYLDLFSALAVEEADDVNTLAWAIANNEVRKQLADEGFVIDDGYEVLDFNVDTDELKYLLKYENMNASVWTLICQQFDEKGCGTKVGYNGDYYVPQMDFHYDPDLQKRVEELWDDKNDNCDYLDCHTVKIDYTRVHRKINNEGNSEDEIESSRCIDCVNADHDRGNDAVATLTIEKAWKKTKREKKLLPLKTAAALTTIVCPKIGIPVQGVYSLLSYDEAGLITTAGSSMGTYYENVEAVGGGTKAAAQLINSCIKYGDLEAEYYRSIQGVLNNSALYYGASYTPNGVKVIEYDNMCELLRWNYIGVKEFDGIEYTREQKYYFDSGEITKRCETIKNYVEKHLPDKYSSAEISAALNRCIYGSECELIKGDDFTYDSLFDIPEDLRVTVLAGINDQQSIRAAYNTKVGNEGR